MFELGSMSAIEKVLLAALAVCLTWMSIGAETTSNLQLTADGKMVPSAVYRWENRPIEIVTAFDAPREVGGVRIMSGRS